MECNICIQMCFFFFKFDKYSKLIKKKLDSTSAASEREVQSKKERDIDA